MQFAVGRLARVKWSLKVDSDVSVVECSYQRHGEQVLEIFNHAILTSTALYDYAPRDLQQIEIWFSNKLTARWPILGLESSSGELRAFGSYGPFRNFPAYKYTVEHSVYVAEGFRGQGLGQTILKLLIDRARQNDYHAMIGAIDANNSASCALHDKLGFELVGKLPQVGFKFGNWLDLALYQLTLNTPDKPIDG